MQDDTVEPMAPKANHSRIETAKAASAKPIASPRAEAHAAATHARKAKKAAGSGKSGNKGAEADQDAIRSREKAVGKPKAGKLLNAELAYKGKVFDVYKDTIVEPNGKEATREIVRHSGSVVMLAVDESKNHDDPEVILIRQYRHAAGQYLVELPAGRIDANEPTLAAAKRELIEETGFRAKRWTPLIKYFASPGFVGEWMQIYLARDLRNGHATPEEDEQIELLPTPLSQAMEMVAAGKIHDGKTLIGLSLYDAGRKAGRL
jgi:ADP-ribose pyrophosphatase